MNIIISKKRFIVILLVPTILFLIAASDALYYYRNYRELLANPQIQDLAQTQNIISDVGKLINLPQGETPTIATVTDPNALKNQAFFAQAEVGDKVLIYSSANKAILYRPGTHQIIEVAPISTGQASTTQQ